MNPMAKHRFATALTRDQTWFGFAAAGTIAVACAAFALSFNHLGQAGQAHGMDPWWLFPLILDAAIGVMVLVDQWLVAHGRRSLLPRLLIWGLAAATVSLNWAVTTDPNRLWRWVFALAPAVWIASVEVLRVMVHARYKGPAAEGITLVQWLAAPWRNLRLWRRRHALRVSWPAIWALDDACQFTAALVAGREDVPGPVTRAIETCRFPAHIAATITGGTQASWEPTVTEWVGGQIALPDKLRAAVSDATPGSARPAAADQAATAQPSRTPRRASRASGTGLSGRTLTAEQIADIVAEHLGTFPVPSVNRIEALGKDRTVFATGYGRPKAIEVHAILEARARPRAVRPVTS